jgi:hypothetical protein
VEDDQTGDNSPHTVSPWSIWRESRALSLSDSENAEALADSLEVSFQPVTVYSVPAVIEMVAVALEPYFQTPASEPWLTGLE